MSSFYNNGEFNSQLGFVIGGFVDFEINEKVHIKPELLYSKQGSEYRLNMENFHPSDFDPTIMNVNYIAKIDENFILLPVMVDYFLSRKVNIEFGPQFGFLINQAISDNNENLSFGNNDPANFELGLNVGLGYNLSDKIRVGARYDFGITDRDELKSSVFQLALNYKLK